MIMIGLSGFCSPTPRALSACMGTSFPPTQHNTTQENTSPSTNISLQHCSQLCWDTPTVHCTVLPSQGTDWCPVLECKTPTELVPRQSLPGGPACRTNQDPVSGQPPLLTTNQDIGQRSSWVSWLSRSQFYIQEYDHNEHNLPSPHNSRLDCRLPQSDRWNINISIPPTCLPTSNTANALMGINNTKWAYWGGGGELTIVLPTHQLETTTASTALTLTLWYSDSQIVGYVCLDYSHWLDRRIFPCRYLHWKCSGKQVMKMSWQCNDIIVKLFFLNKT